MEATGNSHWFVDLAAGMGHQILIGDAAAIRAKQVRKQKTDRRDAAHILDLLLKNDFPKIWTPSIEQRDQRQLLIHRWGLVRLRVRAKNELQHLALNQGVQKKSRLWSKAGQKLLRELPLQYWAGQRRENLLRLMAIFDEQITVLDQAAEKAARESEMARLLMTQPGVGPITSLAFVLTLGDVTRFPRGKQVASYLGLIPRECTTGGRQRLGAISKQGNGFLRMLLVEASHSAVRCDPEFRKYYLHLLPQEGEERGPSGGGAQAGYTTLLDAAEQHSVSGDRSHGEQLGGGPGRRKLDRRFDWALSHPTWLGVRTEKSWSCEYGSNRWLVEREFHRKMI